MSPAHNDDEDWESCSKERDLDDIPTDDFADFQWSDESSFNSIVDKLGVTADTCNQQEGPTSVIPTTNKCHNDDEDNSKPLPNESFEKQTFDAVERTLGTDTDINYFVIDHLRSSEPADAEVDAEFIKALHSNSKVAIENEGGELERTAEDPVTGIEESKSLIKDETEHHREAEAIDLVANTESNRNSLEDETEKCSEPERPARPEHNIVLDGETGTPSSGPGMVKCNPDFATFWMREYTYL